MKISELKVLLTQGRKPEELGIEIKPYIPFIEKKMLVEAILDGCIQIDGNGVYTCDYFMKKLLFDMKVIISYTNIDFSEDTAVEEYDFLVENKILEYVIKKIDNEELHHIYEFLYDELQQKIEIGNSLANIVAIGITKLIDKFPNDKQIKSLSKSLVKDLNNFDWSKIPMLKQIYDTAQGKK